MKKAVVCHNRPKTMMKFLTSLYHKSMSYNAEARNKLSDTLSDDLNDATSLLGVKKVYTADFPNIKMNTVR